MACTRTKDPLEYVMELEPCRMQAVLRKKSHTLCVLAHGPGTIHAIIERKAIKVCIYLPWKLSASSKAWIFRGNFRAYGAFGCVCEKRRRSINGHNATFFCEKYEANLLWIDLRHNLKLIDSYCCVFSRPLSRNVCGIDDLFGFIM